MKMQMTDHRRVSHVAARIYLVDAFTGGLMVRGRASPAIVLKPSCR
jgi:hypothetical protein